MSALTLTPAETIGLVNAGFLVQDVAEREGPMRLARDIVEGAVGDLRVLCHVTTVDAVDPEELGMMLIRMGERLEAAASIMHREIDRAYKPNGAEQTEGAPES